MDVDVYNVQRRGLVNCVQGIALYDPSSPSSSSSSSSSSSFPLPPPPFSSENERPEYI